jgi:hypothetical protein
MKYPKHLSAKQNLLRLMYMNVLLITKPMAEFSNWLLVGVGAIIGAVLVNVEAVSSVVSATSLRWGISFLVISLLTGVVVKQIGASLSASRDSMEELYNELETPEGSAALDGAFESPEEFKEEFSAAFLPLLRGMIRRGFERGGKDPLSGEKRFVKLLCVQIYALWVQNISGAIGLLILAFGIDSP